MNRNKNLSQSLQQKNDLLKKGDKLEIRQNELDATHKIQLEKLENISEFPLMMPNKNLLIPLKIKPNRKQ